MIFRFDEAWYVLAYPDVSQEMERLGIRAEAHYHIKGANEGRSPNRYFDEEWYRSTYADVKACIAAGEIRSGFHHYLLRGFLEHRNPTADFSEQDYLRDHPEVVAAIRSRQYRCGYEHYIQEIESEEVALFAGDSASDRKPSYTPHAVTTPHVAPLHVRVDPILAASPRLNVILPSLQMRHMSGGPNTVINLVYQLAGSGVRVRLMSANTPVETDINELWRHMTAVSRINEKLSTVEIADASNISAPVAIGSNDVFLATAWWTAQMIRDVLPKVRIQRFFYVIQDYEPAMNPWSSEFSMALETYAMDFFPIFNTALLRDYFIANRIERFADSAFSAEALVFEPAIDRDFFYVEPRSGTRKNRLLFYARPTIAPRNLFEIGLSALKRAAEGGVFNNSPWQLCFIGEAIAMTTLTDTISVEPCPWLTYEKYARLMRQSDVLLSLMLSPHPSYPPLEMAACGGMVVTNTFGSKTQTRLQAYSENIIAVEPYVSSIVSGIENAVKRVENHSRKLRHINLHSDWASSFSPVLSKMQAIWVEHTAQVSSGVNGLVR